MSSMKQFWRKNASQTNANSRNPYLERRQVAPQRSASALAGRYVEPDTRQEPSFPSLVLVNEAPRGPKRSAPEPPPKPEHSPKPEHYRSYSFSYDPTSSYGESQIEKPVSSAWNSPQETAKKSFETMPGREILERSVDGARTNQASLAAASLRLSGRTMREDTDSVMEQGVGNLPSEGSDDASLETIQKPVVEDHGRHEAQNAVSERGSWSELTEAHVEERDFSERLYRKFLRHFPQVNGFAADQEADRNKARWLISEASQESRAMVSRLDRQIAQSDAELRKQKKRYRVEMSTQNQRIDTLKQQEFDLMAKLAVVEDDLAKQVRTNRGEIKQELVDKDRQLSELKSALDRAMASAVSQQSTMTQLKRDLAQSTEEVASAKKEIEQLTDKLKKQIQIQERLTQDSKGEIEILHQHHKDLRRRHEEYTTRMREAHTAELSKISANAAQVKKELEEALETALSETTNKHHEQTSSLAERHKTELSDMTQKHQAELASLRGELDLSKDKIARKSSENVKKISKLEADYAQSKADLVQSHQVERAKLEQAAAQARDEASRKLENLMIAHDDKISELKKSIGTSKVDLVQRQKAREEKLSWIHQQQMQQVQEEVRDFNEALLTRDEDEYQSRLFSTSCLPKKTDEEIRHQFDDLRSKVDTFSALEWRKQHQGWTPEVFQKVGERAPEPQLRKAVIQDLVWTQLYHFVFSSPFRIFGSEGKTLEDEWNKDRSRGASENGSRFNWPETSVRAELWRAFTVKGCRDVLSQPLSPLDQRASLKRGFKETLTSLVAALQQELDSIVELTETETALIPKLCKQAATTWLELAMCQSRIVISLTGEDVKSTAEKVAQVRKGSLALTRLPRINRYGTVLGVELSKCTVVEGCDGDCRMIP